MMLVKRMRTKVEAAPALDGEALGCPALAYEHEMETPPELAPSERAPYSGPAGHRPHNGDGRLCGFRAVLARGLDAVNVSHYLIAAPTRRAGVINAHDHVVPVYDDATDDDAPGRDEWRPGWARSSGPG